MPIDYAPELAALLTVGPYLLLRQVFHPLKTKHLAGLCAILFAGGAITSFVLRSMPEAASLMVTEILPQAGSIVLCVAFVSMPAALGMVWSIPRVRSLLRAMLSILPVVAMAAALGIGFGGGGYELTLRAAFALAGIFALAVSTNAIQAGALCMAALALVFMSSFRHAWPLFASLSLVAALGAIVLSRMKRTRLALPCRILGYASGGFAMIAGARPALGALMGGASLSSHLDPRLARRYFDESALLLPFLAGLGFNAEPALVSWQASIAVCGAVLGSAAIRGLLGQSRNTKRDIRRFIPESGLSFGLAIAATSAGLIGDATMAGLVMAYAATSLFPAKHEQDQADASLTLVGISKRQNAGSLIAFAAGIGSLGAPVRVVSVAAPEGSGGMSQTEAEDALVRGIAAGSAIGIEVIPSLVSAASAADGLARAVLERSADALLLGWGSSDRSARNSPFAHDALARATPAMIVSVRYPQAFRTARRLVVVLPTQWQDNPNTEAALSTAARAWGKSLASAEPWILGESGRDTVSHPAFGAKKTRCVRQWRDLPTSIKADAGTAFAIIASRPGSAGWSPGTERLSVILEDAFPKSALCLFYLTDMQTEADKPNPEDTRPGSEEPSLPPLVLDAHKAGRIRANMSEAALVDAVRELAGAIFTDNRGAATALSRELSSIARREPIELEPGVLLLHAHVGALSAPVLAMGARQEGWPLTALSQRVKVLVMLCSPADAPPSMHLQALTELAAALRAQALQHLFPGIDAN